MRILFTLALALVPGLLFADDKSAIELQLQLNKRPAVVCKTRPISYNDAVALSKRTGKPIFVSVGLACQNVCQDLRNSGFITVHQSGEFMGSAEKRAILLVPGKTDVYFGAQWLKVPSDKEIKSAVDDWKKAHPKVSDAIEMNEAAKMLALVMTAIEPAEWVESTSAQPNVQMMWQQVCDGRGNCQMVPVGYQIMPQVGAVEAPTVQMQWGTSESGEVVAEFPRLARGRGLVRRLVGRILRRPVQQPLVRTRQVPRAQAVQPAEDPAAVGGPLRKLVVRAEVRIALKQALESADLTIEQKLVAEKMLKDPNIYETGVSVAKIHADKAVAGGRPVGKLGDGTLFKLLVENLPAILNDIATFLRMLGVIK